MNSEYVKTRKVLIKGRVSCFQGSLSTDILKPCIHLLESYALLSAANYHHPDAALFGPLPLRLSALILVPPSHVPLDYHLSLCWQVPEGLSPSAARHGRTQQTPEPHPVPHLTLLSRPKRTSVQTRKLLPSMRSLRTQHRHGNT